jgi:hypothetical protein
MLKFVQQQMTQLAEAGARDFQATMVRRLSEQLPSVAGMNAAELLDKVKAGIERAAAHHITSEKDVSRFLELAAALGEQFDVDPKLTWAAELLARANPKNATDVMDRLCEEAAQHLAQDAGDGEEPAARPKPRPAADEEFSNRAKVGDPIGRCPRAIARRLYMFSS